MSLSEAIIFFISRLCRCQKHQFSFFRAYVVVRSTNFLFFMLMSLSEAPIFFIPCLCRCQKRLFSLFRVYVVDRSAFFFISCLCRWQKRLFSSFRVYVVDRSMKKLFLALLNGAVAWNSWCCFLQTKNIVFKSYFWSLRIG